MGLDAVAQQMQHAKKKKSTLDMQQGHACWKYSSA